MKCIITITLVLLLFSCSEQLAPTVISILEDQTEEHISRYNPSEVTTGLKIDENLWEGYVFRYQALSGSDYNPITEVKLEAEYELLGNIIEREEKVTQFKSAIENCQRMTKEEHQFSSIFLPLVVEIDYIHTHYPNAKTTLVLFSDLKDHNDWMSWYNKKTKNDKRTFEQYMAHLPKLPEGNTIELRIIYNPTPQENKQFREIVSLYESLCKQMHIHLSVGASI